jgi:hypothetical protein
VNDLGAVVGDGPADLRAGKAEAKGGVSGQGNGRDTLHWVGELAITAEGRTRGLGCNDQWMVAVAGEVVCHAYYAVCDAVDVWWERLRNDRDPHDFTIVILCSNQPKTPLHIDEL